MVGRCWLCEKIVIDWFGEGQGCFYADKTGLEVSKK